MSQILRVAVDADNMLGRQFTELERQNLPFAIVRACNATAFEIRGGLERALLLVDRLEHEPDPQPVRDLLRQEILEMIEAIRAQEITEQQLTYASSVLNQTESGLSALLESLSPSRQVIPFPGGWVTG